MHVGLELVIQRGSMYIRYQCTYFIAPTKGTVLNTGRSQYMPGLRSWKMTHRSKSRKSNINFPFKTVSWGLRDWQPHPESCMITPLVGIWTGRAYVYFMYGVYSIITNCVYCKQGLHYGMCPQFVHLFQVGFIASNFSSVPIVFCCYFTWIVLGDVDLCFSLMLVRTASVV